MPKLPHEQFLSTGSYSQFLGGRRSKHLVFRSKAAGVVPESKAMYSNSIFVNTTDQQFYMADDNGLMYRYDLIPSDNCDMCSAPVSTTECVYCGHQRVNNGC